jgi:hypothetical protein
VSGLSKQRANASTEPACAAYLEKIHYGEYVAIEVESGDYFLVKTMGEALAVLSRVPPSKRFYFLRIGYPAAVSFKNRTSL